jgi:hypothetical protein
VAWGDTHAGGTAPSGSGYTNDEGLCANIEDVNVKNIARKNNLPFTEIRL